MESEGVAWESVVSGVGAFAAAIAALFISLVLPWLRRPKLSAKFANEEPFRRTTQLVSGQAAYWVRILVTNEGATAARLCTGRIGRVFDASGASIDPMQLRWCGLPDARGFEPISLARGQGELLDIFRLVDGDSRLFFETFPDYAPGHPTWLVAGATHEVEIVVTSENANPISLSLEILWDGDFSTLPESLTIRSH